MVVGVVFEVDDRRAADAEDPDARSTAGAVGREGRFVRLVGGGQILDADSDVAAGAARPQPAAGGCLGPLTFGTVRLALASRRGVGGVGVDLITAVVAAD